MKKSELHFSCFFSTIIRVKYKNKSISVGIWSDKYKELAKWYTDVLQLPVKQKSELPGDAYIAFDFGDNWFWIGNYNKVNGNNKDPYRIMVEFYVESVSAAYEDLLGKNVTIIAKPFIDPSGVDNWCMTIQDPDDNIPPLY